MTPSMTPCSMAFTVNGEPHFDDPTRARPDFGKKLEALAAKQGLRFGKAALYPPSTFPGYPHRHFEYCLFTGKTASSDFTPIDFDYYTKWQKLLVRSDLSEEQVLPIVKFIAKHYLRVTIEREPNRWIRDLVVHGEAPPSRQFCAACEKLAGLIGESREIPDLEIQRWPLVRKHLDQMAKCTQEFNHEDVRRMTSNAWWLYDTALHKWIEQYHPKQLDPATRDHGSFAGTVLDKMEKLQTKQDWIDALFIRLEGPRWRYNPELFATLRKACENSREAESIASPVKIGKGFSFITYCDPDREMLRMNVKILNDTFSEVMFRIHGKERWHYVLQFVKANACRVSLKPFRKDAAIDLSLVFRDNKGYDHRMFYSYTRTTGGSKAKYWLEQTKLKKRSKQQL